MIMLMEPNCFLGDGGELSGDDTQAKSENPCGELLGDDTGAKFGVDVGRTDGEDSQEGFFDEVDGLFDEKFDDIGSIYCAVDVACDGGTDGFFDEETDEIDLAVDLNEDRGDDAVVVLISARDTADGEADTGLD